MIKLSPQAIVFYAYFLAPLFVPHVAAKKRTSAGQPLRGRLGFAESFEGPAILAVAIVADVPWIACNARQPALAAAMLPPKLPAMAASYRGFRIPQTFSTISTGRPATAEASIYVDGHLRSRSEFDRPVPILGNAWKSADFGLKSSSGGRAGAP